MLPQCKVKINIDFYDGEEKIVGAASAYNLLFSHFLHLLTRRRSKMAPNMGQPNSVTLISGRSDGTDIYKVHTHPYDDTSVYDLLHNWRSHARKNIVTIPENLLTPPMGLVVIASTISGNWRKDAEAVQGDCMDFYFHARRL